MSTSAPAVRPTTTDLTLKHRGKSVHVRPIHSLFLLLWLGLVSPHSLLSQDGSTDSVLTGISNQGRSQRDPYVTAGDRAYLIGTQDGHFPDLGGHVPGEMGGLWLHPIKLVDGFWVTLTDIPNNQEVALSESAEFINYPHGNRFRYDPVLDGIKVERFQFSPDGQPGVIVEYRLKNASARRRQLRLQLSVKTDLSPVWFSDRLGIEDAPDTVAWDAAARRFVARDIGHPWFAVWGATSTTDAQHVPKPARISTRGPGSTAASSYSLTLEPHAGASLTLVFTGSTMTRKAAENAFDYLARQHEPLLRNKKAHYGLLLRKARIRIPDQRLQQVYDWVRVNAEWLVREVPGMGRGLGGGLMEYPWWFGTETYSLQALAASGNAELAKQSLRLLRDQSAKANGNGRIVHEVTTNGAVSNPGNTQETAQFILTVGKVIQWTGDLDFAREMYPAMRQSLRWLLTDVDRNRNLFPEGYGIMEVLGLNTEVIDVAVYTQQALEATARVAAILGDSDSATRYRELASQLKERIDQRFWIEEESSYGDFYGTRNQAISVTDGAIKQVRLRENLTKKDQEAIEHYERLKKRFSALPDTSRAWITNENWVISTPMEMGIAPRDRAIRLLDRIREKNVGEWGPYLSATEKQAMMTISTGVQAVSEANYGRTDEAMWYVGKIVETFNRKLPGSISEMMPDWGCFTIAWTMYGIVVPLINHVFGIHPDAVRKTVVFEPHLPSGWENLSIADLPIGTNTVSFSRARTGRGIEYAIDAREDGWTFVLKGIGMPDARYSVNGKPVSLTDSGVRLNGRRNRVLVVPR
jgi:glycogen debranching enzyme